MILLLLPIKQSFLNVKHGKGLSNYFSTAEVEDRALYILPDHVTTQVHHHSCTKKCKWNSKIYLDILKYERRNREPKNKETK
jgi:hypothetical protein